MCICCFYMYLFCMPFKVGNDPGTPTVHVNVWHLDGVFCVDPENYFLPLLSLHFCDIKHGTKFKKNVSIEQRGKFRFDPFPTWRKKQTVEFYKLNRKSICIVMYYQFLVFFFSFWTLFLNIREHSEFYDSTLIIVNYI